MANTNAPARDDADRTVHRKNHFEPSDKPDPEPAPGQWTSADLEGTGIGHSTTRKSDEQEDTDDGTAPLNQRMPDRRVKSTSFKRHAQPKQDTTDLERVADEYDPFGHGEVEKAGTRTYDDVLSLSLEEIEEAQRRQTMSEKDVLLELLDTVQGNPAAADRLQKELRDTDADGDVTGDRADREDADTTDGPSDVETAAVGELAQASGHSPETVRALLTVKAQRAQKAESYRELAGYLSEGSEAREAVEKAAESAEAAA